MDRPRYIAIEGPIGVGKSSLAKKLGQELGAQLILEDPAANPFLQLFYKDRQRYALKTQILFLINRYLQQKELMQQNLFSRMIVSDYLFSKDQIFAAINLNEEEKFLYEKIYTLLDQKLTKPDLVIFLQASHGVLMRHIRDRAVDYEKNMEGEYLEEVIEAYNQYFFNYNESPLIVVNVSDIDFVKNKTDYESLLREIVADKRGQKTYVAIGR